MNGSTLSLRKRAFTLIETVIAIGVLAVLLTGFMLVFGPAADGIRTSINAQTADRLATTFEQELVNLRPGQASSTSNIKSAFDKAFDFVQKSNVPATALMVYQYRASLTGAPRSDGSLPPRADIKGAIAGEDYLVKTMMRRADDPEFTRDLPAVEGAVFFGICRQLVFDSDAKQLRPINLVGGSIGLIRDPNFDGKGGDKTANDADSYPEAVLAFITDFHIAQSRDPAYFSGAAFTTLFNSAATSAKRPLFSRNMAVRR